MQSTVRPIAAFFVCHVIAMSSTCYNPLLYAWHNETFRHLSLSLSLLLTAVAREQRTHVIRHFQPSRKRPTFSSFNDIGRDHCHEIRQNRGQYFDAWSLGKRSYSGEIVVCFPRVPGPSCLREEKTVEKDKEGGKSPASHTCT